MGSGHKTLLYGNAILLRHANSGMFLACLSSNSGTDKLAFDVGLQESSEGEAEGRFFLKDKLCALGLADVSS